MSGFVSGGGKGQPAASGTASPIGAAPAHHGGEVALSGHAHAKRPLDKYFQFDAASLTNGGNFLQGKFAGQHCPGKAHFFQLAHPFQGMNAHLGGSVDGHSRGAAAH